MEANRDQVQPLRGVDRPPLGPLVGLTVACDAGKKRFARPASVYDDRWGVARLVEDTYVITRHLHQKGAIDAARLAPPIPVTYCTVTGEQHTDHLLGLAWLPSDRWVGAVNGRAVEQPGEVASQPATTPGLALREAAG
jgi:hypothetical protein